jgi:hypothetical protein
MKNILTIIFATYFSLLIVEVSFMFTNLDYDTERSNIQKLIKLKKKTISFDKRNLIEFYSDYKKINKNVVLSTTSTGLNSHLDSSFIINGVNKILPLSGISNKETILCNENGYYAKYNSDNFGFNNPSRWQKKYDYLLLGDSIVEGFCVNEKDNLAGNLKKLLNKKDSVINLGRGANGPLKNYAILKEYLNLTKVDKILYFHTAGNDLDDLEYELNHPILKNYLTNRDYLQNLSQIQNLIDKNLMLKTEEIIKKHYEFAKFKKKEGFTKHLKLHRVIRFKNKISRNIKKPNEENPKKKLINSEFKNILKLMNDLSNEKNIQFYFIYVPSYYNNSLKAQNEKIINLNDKYYLDILRVVNELKIPIIDLRKKLLEKNNDPLSLLPFRMIGHFNEYGNKIISNLIFSEVK